MRISDVGIMELEGMEFHAYHGCFQKEREEGNLFVVDFKAQYHFKTAAKTDRLEETVDYGDVYKVIRELPGTRTVDEMGCKEPEAYDFLVEAERDSDIRRPLFLQMSKLGYPILMLRPMDIELEDIFLQLTNDKGEEQ